MTVALWVTTGVLAAAFLAAGGFKIARPIPALQEAGMHWTEGVRPAHVKALGALEVLGAIGLVLPWLLDTARWLTPLAAAGLVATMAGAAVVHLRRHESPAAPLVVLVLLAVVGGARVAALG